MADSGAIEVVARKLQSHEDKGAGLDAFSLLCGPAGRAAYGQRHQQTMQQCVVSVAQCLAGQPMDIVAKACAILRDISSDSGNWHPIKQHALPTLAQLLQINSHLDNPTCDSTAIVVDAATAIANMAVLEEHCRIVLQHGGLASLAWLISAQNHAQLMQRLPGDGKRSSLLIVTAALNALGHLCESSAPCREASVREGLFTRVDPRSGQKVVGPLLMLLAQTVPSLEGDAQSGPGSSKPGNRPDVSLETAGAQLKKMEVDAADRALYCVEIISKDPRSRMALVDCEASMNLVLELPKTRNRALRGRAMAVVLQVVHDGSSAAVVWHNVRQQGDINLAFELLAVGDSSIKAQACAAIKALSTPAIPGQAPQVTATELVRRGVGPTLVGVLADKKAGADDGAHKAQACAAECLSIMTGAEESHEDLIRNGIANALTILLPVKQMQPKAEIINLNSGLQICKNLAIGRSGKMFWESLVKLARPPPSNQRHETSPLGRFFESFGVFLTNSAMDMGPTGSGEIPDAAAVLASMPIPVLRVPQVVGHLMRVDIPKILVSLVHKDQHSKVRLASLKALEKLVQQVGLARALCNNNAVPVVLEMLRLPNESDQTRQELAAMLAALTRSDAVRVAESMVGPVGMEAIKLMLGADQSPKTQVSIVGILSSMADGSAAVRAAICEAAIEIGPALERSLVSLGVDISELRILKLTDSPADARLGENAAAGGSTKKPEAVPKATTTGGAPLRTNTVDILYSGVIKVGGTEANGDGEAPFMGPGGVSEVPVTAGIITPTIAGFIQPTVATHDHGMDLPPKPIQKRMAIATLEHCMNLLLRLGVLDANRRVLCERAPHLIDCLVASMGLPSGAFSAEDASWDGAEEGTRIRINAMKAFAQLSLAAPIVGTDYRAWQKGYATLVKVPANSATSTEAELTAALDALRALLSVYPEIAADPPALLKVVGPMAIVATAKDLKIAGLQLLVQMLSSHELVEKAFGAGSGDSEIVARRKLVMFTEHLVTDLERLRDGMAPSLAALQGGGNDLLCMWSLLTLRALCANVGFRNVLLSSHTSVLGLLSSFERSRNPCVGHIAESTRRLIGGNVDHVTAVQDSRGTPAAAAATRISAAVAAATTSHSPVLPTYGGAVNRSYGHGESLKVATPPHGLSKPSPPSYNNSSSSNTAATTATSDRPHTSDSRGGRSNQYRTKPTTLPPSYGGGRTALPPGYLMEKSPDPSPPRTSPPAPANYSNPSFAPVDTSASNEDIKIRQLVEMGFNAHQARLTLEAVGWDIGKAVAVLSNDPAPQSGANQLDVAGGSSGKRPLRFKIPPGVSPGQTVTIQDSATGKKHAVRSKFNFGLCSDVPSLRLSTS